MHTPELRHQALALVAQGINDCEIARRLGVPRTTVREWRAPHYVAAHSSVCPRCWKRAKPLAFSAEDYALLLGLYLGDGCISRMGRTFRLRIHLDTKYGEIIRETTELLERCFRPAPVGVNVKDGGSCAVVGVYSNHLPCLFPQHGPGKKHERRIELECWQQSSVDAAPWSFVRGLIWSDGCTFMNRTGPYEYLSYGFTNRSTHIIDLLIETYTSLGLRPSVSRPVPDGRPGQVRINHRGDVAQLVEHVGIKR